MLSKSKMNSKRKTVSKRKVSKRRVSKRRVSKRSKRKTVSKRSKRTGKQKGGSLAVIPGISIPGLDENNKGLIIKEVVANVSGC